MYKKNIMRHIKLIIEYDGTNYVGWQLQPNGLSVQEVLEGALKEIIGESVRLYSSGRTDAGVHALGMVACFRTSANIPLTAFTEGVNNLLPQAIAVKGAEEVAEDFNPRFNAKGKHYRYSICCSALRSPTKRLYSWYLKRKPDIAKMKMAASYFIGEHDFGAFRTTGCVSESTIKRIDSVEIWEEGDMIYIDVHGSGFLRNMVRIMAGSLVDIGMGKFEPERIKECLENTEIKPGQNAPACGLCLIEVFY